MAEYNLAERAYKIADGSIGLCLTAPFALGAYALLKMDELRSDDVGDNPNYSPLAQTTVATACFDALCALEILEGLTGHRWNPRVQ